jgi:hypothetical protein
VQQRRGSFPVFGGGWREDDLGHVAGRPDSRQRIALLPRHGVALRHRREGKELRAAQIALMAGRIRRGHAEPLVEPSFARPSDVDQPSVEDRPGRLVRVESVVQEVMNQPARLRDPEHVGEIHRPGQRVGRALPILLAVLEERPAVANRRQPQAGDARVRARVGEVVQPAGTKTFLDVQALRVSESATGPSLPP